jgi:hypothetical protein
MDGGRAGGTEVLVYHLFEAPKASPMKPSTLASRIERRTYLVYKQQCISELNHLMERMGQTEAPRVWKPAAEILSSALNDRSTEGRGSSSELRAIVGMYLAAVARYLDRVDSSRICRQPSRLLVEDLKRETNPLARGALAEAIAMLAGPLESSEASRICGSTFQILCDDLRREDDPVGREALVRGISMLAGRMDRTEAARLCAQALSLATREGIPGSEEDCASLVKEMGSGEALRMATSTLEPRDGQIPAFLAAGLESLASSGRLEPIGAVRVLTRALEREGSAEVRRHLAGALSEVSRRMQPAEAAAACTPGARLLAEALLREKDADDRGKLTAGLATLCSRIEATQASRICEGALRHLLLAGGSGRDEFDPEGDRLAIERDVSVLLPFLDTAKATSLAREWVTRLCSRPFTGSLYRNGRKVLIEERLNALLSDTSRPEQARRAARMATVSLVGGPPAAARIAVEPFPCRLTTPELVELLKMPTCFGKARRAVLDHLGNRYGRRFGNDWAFVRFANEQNLGLDFTTPPKRPDPKESVKRMLEILDEPADKH